MLEWPNGSRHGYDCTGSQQSRFNVVSGVVGPCAEDAGPTCAGMNVCLHCGYTVQRDQTVHA